MVMKVHWMNWFVSETYGFTLIVDEAHSTGSMVKMEAGITVQKKN